MRLMLKITLTPEQIEEVRHFFRQALMCPVTAHAIMRQSAARLNIVGCPLWLNKKISPTVPMWGSLLRDLNLILDR